jgi:hypothetical protein
LQKLKFAAKVRLTAAAAAAFAHFTGFFVFELAFVRRKNQWQVL